LSDADLLASAGKHAPGHNFIGGIDIETTQELNCMQKPKLEPLVFAIFGASGDLAKRKLIPAVFDLFQRGYLPDSFALLGLSRTLLSDESFRQEAFWENEFCDFANVTQEQKQAFAERLYYQPVDTEDPADYVKVKSRLAQLEQERNTGGNCIFYLSTPPSLYATIPAGLAKQGLNTRPGSYRRLVIEKPFGYDLESAVGLNRELKTHFDEENIYRIDHYLGKETVQNLLVTRFTNGIFEPLWNRNYIHHIEITSAEDIGVGSRGGYYEKSGAMRDMLQNHLMQLVAHVAMEPPISTNASSIRSEKNKLFQSLKPISELDVSKLAVRGQYLTSHIRGQRVKGYREEQGVPADSRTETFVALKFFIENWRWAGVPFFIRTGKRLPTRVAEITVTFKDPPQALFRRTSAGFTCTHNQLVLRIQPDEGVLLKFGMKVPGEGFEANTVSMDFKYSDLDSDVPEAYERLLLDCMKGDATLYAHGESVENSWRFIKPILERWENDPDVPIYGYPAGSWGPEASDELMRDTGMTWRNPCKNLTNEQNFCEL
jgi:glucose-6-phosphate 1-dehydrogenase